MTGDDHTPAANGSKPAAGVDASIAASMSPGKRRGRRVARVVYWLFIVGVAIPPTVEITAQVMFAPQPKPPWGDCRTALHALYSAVERARAAAAGTDGEDAALARYRGALYPEWSFRDGVADLCRSRPDDEAALDVLSRLRYAEEHAVRREADDLSPLRRQVNSIFEGDAPPPRAP